MSREIKFRAWEDVGTKSKFRMTYNIGILPTIGGFNENGFGLFLHPKDYKVMQYTGLKDKNGIEIYEGDIIAFDGSNSNKVMEFTKYGQFMLDRIYGGIEAPRMEVIGNIYENSDLLTQ